MSVITDKMLMYIGKELANTPNDLDKLFKMRDNALLFGISFELQEKAETQYKRSISKEVQDILLQRTGSNIDPPTSFQWK